MKIGLIAVSGVRIKSKELAELGVTLPGFIRRGKVIASLPSLGLLTIAGMTPERHEVHYLEVENESEINGLPEFDLVGISSLTAKIDLAYKISHSYRERGTPTVMGGLHVSVVPEEASKHTNSVVVGGAEGVWGRVLEDAENGALKPFYQGAFDNVFEPELYTKPRFELLDKRPYNRVTIQTSRGCPRKCDFCAASLRITSRFNQKPVDLVIDEIREARRWFRFPFFEFADDNTFLNRDWSKSLLKKLRSEEISWFTETDISVAEDLGLCDLLAESGCKQVLIGFESPFQKDLDGIDPSNWKYRQASRYRKVIDTLQSRGVSVNGCFILGLDHQTPDVFPDLLDFVKSSSLAEVQYTVLTPFPGTELYARLKHERRLLSETFWNACTLFDVNYRPSNMTVEELENGLHWLFEKTYTADESNNRKRSFIEQKIQRTQTAENSVY